MRPRPAREKNRIAARQIAKLPGSHRAGRGVGYFQDADMES
jgi:hypothetical protein